LIFPPDDGIVVPLDEARDDPERVEGSSVRTQQLALPRDRDAGFDADPAAVVGRN